MNAGGSARPQRRSSSAACGPVTLIAPTAAVRSTIRTSQSKRLRPVAQPRLRTGRAAGGEREREAAVAVADDDAVVEHVAALVEHQRVADPPRHQVVHPARVDALQEPHGIGAADDHLAERRHVAERHRLAHGAGTRPPVSPYVQGRHQPPNRSMRAPRARCSASSAVRRTGGKKTPAAASSIVIWRVIGRAVNGAGAVPARAARNARTCGRQAAPWQVPVPASVARLTSSRSWKPRSQTDVEIGDGGAGAAADDALGRRRRQVAGAGRVADHAHGEAGALPGQAVARVQAEIEHDGVGLVATLGAVAAADDDRAHHALALEPHRAGRRPPPAPSRPAAARPPPASAAARAVHQPASSLPGQTGCSSAAPVAITTSPAWTCSIPSGRRTTGAGRRRCRPPPSPSRASTSSTVAPVGPRRLRRRHARPGPRPTTTTSQCTCRSAAGARRRGPRPPAARRGRPGAAPPRRRGPASGSCARRRRRRSRTGSAGSRRPGRACRRRRDGSRPAAAPAPTESPGRERHRCAVDRQDARGGRVSRPRCHRA